MHRPAPKNAPPIPAFWGAFRYWLTIGFISFSGPAGQIAIMHQELVEKRCWISERRFLHALNYCMVLPGPEAQQLAIFWAGCCTASGAATVPAPTHFRPGRLAAFVALWRYQQNTLRAIAACTDVGLLHGFAFG